MYHVSDTYMNNQDTKQLEIKIQKTKNQLAKIGDMRPGSLSLQQRRVKKEAYGQYWQLSYTFKGKGHTEYVPDDCAEKIQEEIANFKRYRELFETLVELSIELSKLRIRKAREAQA